MAVFVDNAAIMFKGKHRFHMTADSLTELHAFAQQCGIKRCWFHPVRGHPHYDITSDERTWAIEQGAIAVSARVLLQVAQRLSKN